MVRSLLFAALVFCLARQAGAQIAASVADPNGTAVEGATVDLLDTGARVASQTTDARGAFRFGNDITELKEPSLLIRRIGFAPVVLQLNTGKTLGPIVLTRLPAALPVVRVAATSRTCPRPDDPTARAIWAEAAAQYAPGTGITIASKQRMGSATVDSADAQWGASPDGAVTASRSRAGGLWKRRVQREGYMWALPARHLYKDFGATEYPPLDQDFAWHFSDSVFANRHSLSIGAQTDYGVELLFCPQSSSHGGLSGALVLSRDRQFLSARWTFIKRGHRELAGGEMAFAPHDTGAQARPLLPVAGMFWRRLFWGGYHQRWAEYDEWNVLPFEAMDPNRP